MAKQLMIYEQVVPVNAKQHGELSVEGGIPYEFARELRAVPLVAQEIAACAQEYTVVFAPSGKEGEVIPFVVLGLQENENLYVNKDGEWDAKYIPAFIRRYPFVFAANEDRTRFTLCIDETWQGCNKEGRGQKLFDDKGEKSEFLDRLLKFNEEYQKNSMLTEVFCKQLQELELLDSREARINLQGGGEVKLTGFMVINREKLINLDGDKLSEMVKSGALELIYAHLLSMKNLGIVASRIVDRRASQDQAAEA